MEISKSLLQKICPNLLHERLKKKSFTVKASFFYQRMTGAEVTLDKYIHKYSLLFIVSNVVSVRKKPVIHEQNTHNLL